MESAFPSLFASVNVVREETVAEGTTRSSSASMLGRHRDLAGFRVEAGLPVRARSQDAKVMAKFPSSGGVGLARRNAPLLPARRLSAGARLGRSVSFFAGGWACRIARWPRLSCMAPPSAPRACLYHSMPYQTQTPPAGC